VTDIAGQVAVVTGASRGIGAATAAVLANAGARVVRVARALPRDSKHRYLDHPCDLTDMAAWRATASRILADAGVPSIVVSNAGAFVLKLLHETTQEDFDAQLDINLRAPFAVAHALLPPMRAAGRGTFIHVGSVADHSAFPENAAYAASKFGLRGLHEVLVAEYRGTGVRLSLLSPGPTDTAVWDPVDPDHQPHLPDRASMLRPSDVAEAVLFLATRPANVHVDWLRLGPV
jgi:NAD(P)-dependent dehydrogenase (short-subunit alcohol dehydrogenase family)